MSPFERWKLFVRLTTQYFERQKRVHCQNADILLKINNSCSGDSEITVEVTNVLMEPNIEQESEENNENLHNMSGMKF